MRSLLFVFLLICILPLRAQAATLTDIKDACATLIAAPDQADYRALRRLILVVMASNPDDVRKQAGEISKEAGEAYSNAVKAGDFPQAERHMQRLMSVSCLFARTWHTAAAFYEKNMNDAAKAARHREIAIRIEKAAATFTDGKKAPLPTIGIGEEYDFIRILQCQNPMRGSVHYKGKIHDRWQCNRPGISDDTILMAPYYDLNDLPP